MSNPWGPHRPNLWTSQFFSLFSKCFSFVCIVLFECEYPFIDKSMVILERLSITFTSKGKSEFVPRDKVFPITCPFDCSLFLHISFTQFFIHENGFKLFLSAHFFILRIFTHLKLTFAVCRMRRAQTLSSN